MKPAKLIIGNATNFKNDYKTKGMLYRDEPFQIWLENNFTSS